MHEHPAEGPAREEGRLDPRRDEPRQARPRRRRGHGRPHRAPAWPPRCCASAACRASTGRPSPCRWSRTRARSSCSTSAPTPTRRPRTSTSTRTWARSSRRTSSASATRASRSSRSGRRRARATRASSATTELLDGSALRFTGNVEGKDLVHHMADVVVCDAVLGNVTIKFFEGLSTFIFDLVQSEFRRPPRGPLAYLLMRPGHRSHPEDLRLREAGRIAAARRQGHGDHHARPGEAADDRLRERGRAAAAERASRTGSRRRWRRPHRRIGRHEDGLGGAADVPRATAPWPRQIGARRRTLPATPEHERRRAHRRAARRRGRRPARRPRGPGRAAGRTRRAACCGRRAAGR